MQEIITGANAIEKALNRLDGHRYLLVCDAAFPHFALHDILRPHAVFDDFTSNPQYKDVCRGVELFNTSQCDAIVAIGGGSTIDVAKCIKLYCRMDATHNYLEQECHDSGIPLMAIPTTAGTGSESTRYAVIYYQGKKQSITHESIVPTFAVLYPPLLTTLSLYQKKCTMLDALCQGIESWWSVNSTETSMLLSQEAVGTIIKFWQAYILHNDPQAAEHIMYAANRAGQAINITQTTAPHAMSYKLTSIYGLPHGHAVALCLPEVWQYIIDHATETIDARGVAHLNYILEQIAVAMQCSSVQQCPEKFRTLMAALQMTKPTPIEREAELRTFSQSVNPIRLKNNPVALSEETIYNLYNHILP